MFSPLRRSPVVFAVLVFVLANRWSLASADDADPVKEKLYKAKKNYDTDMQKFKKAISDSLDKREGDARKVGNKKVVDQVKAERAAFEKTGELPQGITKEVRDTGIAARTKLEKAYAAAVKDYLRLKLDDAADKVEKEREKFQLESAFLFNKRAYLVSLKHFGVKVYDDWFSNDGTASGKSGEKVTKLTMNGEPIPHSLFLHVPVNGDAEVSYPLEGKWKAFRATVGAPKIEENTIDPGSQLTFEVLADGKSLWKSEPVTKVEVFQTCTLKIEKVKTLTLRVHCPGRNDGGRAVWYEPILAE